ncbi:oxysterol-binding protein-related protein 9-like isoform X2 [Acanthaster planci]|uniref:Oxysterol-binding protein n=1 Tax=Acanthaster planci TaxID=133434 RepID=A0A8B7YBY7_ACAPL|nr:oxysterol-binding protein-related protein 9-like isoform X2 [Acanthaster planci]
MSAFSSKTSMEGPLSKWTNVMKGWQYRWFVLDYQTGLLSYYVSKEKMMRGSRRGCVRLRGALIGIDDQDDSTFTITCDQKTFHFQAQHADERVQWVTALEETILKHSQPARFGSKSRPRPKPTVQDFDRKLAESDAYLQILIDQVTAFEERIEKLDDEAERQKYEQLRTQAKAMIESVKQAIVLLQLAKNTVNPVNGLLANEIDATHPDNQNHEPLDNQVPLETQVSTHEVESTPVSSSSVELATECFEENNASVPSTPPLPTQVIPRTEHIPALSYSSSDDEDFYDADEFPDLDLGPPQGRPPIEVEDEEEAEQGQEFRPHEHQPSMYEEESEEEMLDCESHGSVISHLLSQVRLGMDLTKVVLPTFILERRSLLEMYADFLAHPELFANISDLDSPKDRMVQVVKWFMTAFHAGRNSSVAKKPYNPILGETMRCWWDLGPENGKIDGSEEQVTDGPVPWATKDQVTFIAEQVSHHPPISAFYAEHYNKQMSINAHIWTKSKFLGLSIGVENVGQACVSDLKHEEEYIMTFPNGYGRSILTVPWFEMGGKCIISCAKTGFTGTITFLTKPFYGGKRHRVTGEVAHVSDRKPFMTITGEWNGVLTAKHANGETEAFADTTTMKVNKKRIMPVEKQGEYESKRLWKDVTHYLKTHNIDKATASKHFLEERQRREAKERKEKGEKWQTKFFHEDGESWIFDNPLEKRIKAAQEDAGRKQQQQRPQPQIPLPVQQQQQQQQQPPPALPSASTDLTNSHIPGVHGDGPAGNKTTAATRTANQELMDFLS